MNAKVIRFPANADLRKAPTPTLWDRLWSWLNPPPKAPVFEIKNPRLTLALRRRARRS